MIWGGARDHKKGRKGGEEEDIRQHESKMKNKGTV